MSDSNQPPEQPGDATPPPPPPPGGGYGQAPPPPPPPGGGYGGQGYGGQGYGQAPPPPPAPPGGGYGGQGGQGYRVGDAFSYGWQKFKANLGAIVVAGLLILVVSVAPAILGTLLTGGFSTASESTDSEGLSTGFALTGGGLNILFQLISTLLSLIVQAGVIKGVLNITYGRKLELAGMFSGINFGQVIIAALLIAVASAIGFVLCIIPGLLVTFFTWFTMWFIVDKDMTAIEGIKASFYFVRNNAGPMLLLLLASVAAYVAGFVLCFVGLLVAVPVVLLAHGYTYRTLQGESVAA